MDDTVRSLIRFVARGFYSTPYVLILDAVLLHSVLSEDDLTHLLSIKRKELRSLCNKLCDDRLLSGQVQKEENFALRLTTRTYYYIHITEAIDAIKWKVHSIVNLLKQEMSHFGNPQGYVCPRCGKKVSQLDAISLLNEDKTDFECDVCGGVLIEDDSLQQALLRQFKLEKLMGQVDPVIGYLKRIDESSIEDNNFEGALMKAIPAQSSSNSQYTAKMFSKIRTGMLQSLQNAASKAQATLHVSITANDENYEREVQEKEESRLKIEQNALPSWHLASTVGGQSGVGKLEDEDADAMDVSKDATPDSKVKMELSGSVTPVDEKPIIKQAAPVSNSEVHDKEGQDALAAYYAQLAENEDDEDDEDDDDEFDDLI